MENRKYYYQGWNDYENGTKSCPYEKGTWRYSQWKAGWRDAHKFWRE